MNFIKNSKTERMLFLISKGYFYYLHVTSNTVEILQGGCFEIEIVFLRMVPFAMTCKKLQLFIFAFSPVKTLHLLVQEIIATVSFIA